MRWRRPPRGEHPPWGRRPRCGPLGRRLSLQIYAALLGVAVACVAVAGASASLLLGDHRPLPDAVPAVAAFLVADLPPGDGLDPALEERAADLHLRLALWSPQGGLLASTDPQLPGPEPGAERARWIHTDAGPGFLLLLPDGRWLSGTLAEARPSSQSRHFLVLLSLLATLAIGGHALARRITRRLEHLQRGVETLGRGDLSARVPVRGFDEVAALALSFNSAADRIQALVEGQKRMLAHTSHELRSPLARVRLALEMIVEAPDGDERQHWHGEAEREIAELDELIGELLLMSRLEGAALPLEQEPCDLLALAQEEAARTGASVSGASIFTHGDSRTLRRLLRNLLENARRHAAGAAEVTVEAIPGGARLTVADRGPGVPPGEESRIFDPFYRVNRQADGSGLGLALVQRIAAAHGGQARYEPRPGGGSLFRVDLPIRPPPRV